MTQTSKRLTLAVVIATAFGFSAATATAQTAIVTVVHGINGSDLGLDEALPVDVYVSGLGCALEDFTFRSITDRIEVAADTYDVRVSLPAATPCGGDIVIDAPGVGLAEGSNTTIIAHLDAAGSPTASVFANDLSLGEEGKGRAVLHHTAAAPAVDIRVYGLYSWHGRGAVISLDGVVNGQSAAAELRRGIYFATIAPAGQRPAFYDFLFVAEDVTSEVYVVGSAGKGSIELLIDSQDQIADPEPQDLAEVTVIHGIPGIDLGLDPTLPVDVLVNGELCALTNFVFGEVSDRLPLAPGIYDIQVLLASEEGPCEGGVAINAEGVEFFANESATVVAHLTEDGGLTASKFVNDLSPSTRWKSGRIGIHHTAAAPAVDIRVNRSIYSWWWRRVLTLLDVSNGDSADADVRRGHYSVSISPTVGSPGFRTLLEVNRREAVRVYAVGSLENGTFTVIADRQKLNY